MKTGCLWGYWITVGVMMLAWAAPLTVIASATISYAADPVATCQSKKLKAWAKLRLCEHKASAKEVIGGTVDPTACRTKFNAAMTKAGTACRYLTMEPGTVTDLDTGLQWEQKTGTPSAADNSCSAQCPKNVTFIGSLSLAPPCNGATFRLDVSFTGTSWSGTAVTSCGTFSDFVGTITGTTLSGSGAGGLVTVAGTVNCGLDTISGTFAGTFSGTWIATICPDPHDVNNNYDWSAGGLGGRAPDGKAFTSFLAKLNACQSSDGTTVTGGFAGHCDWRLPQIDELFKVTECTTSMCYVAQSPIVDLTTLENLDVWSTTVAPAPDGVYYVWYDDGTSTLGVGTISPATRLSVIAVRSGL